MSVLKRLWVWFHSTDGRTWLGHSLLALGFALFVEAWVGLAYYWGREVIQIAVRADRAGKAPIHVVKLDDLLDACFPLWVVAMYLALPFGPALFLPISAIPLGAIAILVREDRP